jgi:hypothetical protein
MKKTNYSRRQRKTLLLVGEGYDEQAFLNYLKSELISRESGIEIKIKNAKGKGAAHVLDWTIKQAAIAKYDQVGALFDTDTDWNQSVEKKAKKHKIYLLKSEPCFEAMLLRLIGIVPEIETKKLKKQFGQYVNEDSTVSKNYNIYFNLEVLFAHQEKEPTIKLILSLLKT